ncbi:MAG: flagellar biosynthetic protein FliR [Deltaproteobacteria bacterium]|nr:flagellar biosynthetic protein FliR [Deltaproteobacteria bacterium]
MGAPVINAAEFAAFVLVFLRLSVMMVVAPVFDNQIIPAPVKAALVLMLAFVVAPKVSYSPALMPMTWFGFVFLALGELFIGLSLALMVRLVLDSAHVAGEYISFQMGMSMLNAMDPQSGGQMAVVSLMVNLIMTLIFLYANGHLLVLKAVINSFQVAPPGLVLAFGPEYFSELMRAMAGLYVLALKISAPVMAVLFCCKVAFGVVAKAMPQMNILFVSMPVYIFGGLIVLMLSLPWWPLLLGRALVEADAALGRLLDLLGHQAIF